MKKVRFAKKNRTSRRLSILLLCLMLGAGSMLCTGCGFLKALTGEEEIDDPMKFIFSNADKYRDDKAEEDQAEAEAEKEETSSGKPSSAIADITPSGQKEQTADASSEKKTAEETAKEAAEENANAQGAGQSSFSTENSQNELNSFYYDQLTANEKKVYAEIYESIVNRRDDIKLSATEKKVIARVYQAVINDHPEIYYLDGYTYSQHTVNGKLEYVTMSGNYTYSAKQQQETTEKLEQAAAKILAGMPGGSDYEKIKYVYEYIILNTDYQTGAKDNQNICSVLLTHASVCNGYAKATQYLLQRAGVQCIIVSGTAKGDAHAWNIVRADGAYYQMDTTWGDPSYEGGSGGTLPDIDYGYLLITTQEMKSNHSFDKEFIVPDCTSVADNYFVKEGLYVTSCSDDQIRMVVDRCLQQGRGVISFKMADDATYKQVFDYLFNQRKVFDFYKGVQSGSKYSMAYNNSDNIRTINIWS